VHAPDRSNSFCFNLSDTMSLIDPYSLDDGQSSTAIRRVVLSAMQVQSDLAHLGSHYPGNVLGCRKFESAEIAKKMRAFAASEAQLKLAIDCTSEEDLGLPEDAWETDSQARSPWHHAAQAPCMRHVF
jgi:hypothetical protein